MGKELDIWQIGNTGLRSPARVWEGLRIFADSPFNGDLRGANEARFQELLIEKGLVKPTGTAKDTSSYARKWRYIFGRFGLTFPKVNKKDGQQDELGILDEVTPFGYTFLKADSDASRQECFLRSLSVEQYPTADKSGLFSPLRWILAIMLELERQTGSSELTRIEFCLWGQTTDPTDEVKEVVAKILDLRERRMRATAKRRFDSAEISARAQAYSKQKNNFTDYGDMNMRYLRIGGVLHRKGRGLEIASSKHVLAEQLAKLTMSHEPILETYRVLCHGAPLPIDNRASAMQVLRGVEKQLKDNELSYDLSKYDLSQVSEINMACQALEQELQEHDEMAYAQKQPEQWQEISEYMRLLTKGGGKSVNHEDENEGIEVPREEAASYLEWTLWRALLAMGHLENPPSMVRHFRLDADFFPVSTAGGGQGDLYSDYADYSLLTEVTLSTSSRQEAMEGEPVRRHLWDEIQKNRERGRQTDTYGLFIANKVNNNTAETFRHGVWYDNEGSKERLDIVPMDLADFREFFMMLFEEGITDKPTVLKNLLTSSEAQRDSMDAPEWCRYISRIATGKE
ncbi:AlwI family type II restriction endonuclease [Bifidobacterium cuniculi]|uniref:AlwI restriction endonuclease n=1 Tax=Bifidobacterium cuniculi TaxID=1688 RepID=A0A087AZM0_9BIFI|nr:AlwI family type II restriction endonuclease [Bifidobacterium cuniculi]KFI64220.1 AlwI restriction endonuclease [Bifidobacterium cuniculi]